MRTKPLMDANEERKRLARAKARRLRRWEHDKPTGQSVRQLRRAIANGYSAGVQVKNPSRYLSGRVRRVLNLALGRAA